jgi:hypothetical protein
MFEDGNSTSFSTKSIPQFGNEHCPADFANSLFIVDRE